MGPLGKLRLLARPSLREVVRHGPRSRPSVAITFDDGPSEHTEQNLELLDRAGVRSTLFVIGEHAEARAETVRSAHERGHEIANHSYAHERRPPRESLERTSAVIERITGAAPSLFRPPYGELDGALVGNARALGLRTILWDVNPRDWERPGADRIAREALSAVPGSIVLLHDGRGDRSQTTAALPRIVEALAARGHRLVTVSELLRS